MRHRRPSRERPGEVDRSSRQYEHLAGNWRRATDERRRGLIGELELLALQLPAVDADDPDREEVVVVRAAIRQLVTEIRIELADPS